MVVRKKEDVLLCLRRHWNSLKELGVRRVGLFGSFVRGEQTASSDIDILVEFEPGHKTFDNFIRTAFLLEKLLGRRVELVTPEALSPYLKPYIMHEVEYVPFGD